MKYIKAVKGEIFGILSETAYENNIKAFVVGGYVRDFFLGIPNDDIDIVVEGSGIEFAKKVAKKVGSKVQYYENYGTAMVKIEGLDVEFVGARKEMYERGSRNPIVEEGTIMDDQLRRDFTINAMAFSINKESYGELVDNFGGLYDLKNGIIRTIQDPDITFSDDPLRMYRAVRFLCKLSCLDKNFIIEKGTYEGIENNINRIDILSQERITNEIDKILSYSNPYYGIKTMFDLGLPLSNKKVDGMYFTFNRFSDSISGIDKLCSIEKNLNKDFKMLKWYFIMRFTEFKNSPEEFMDTMKLPSSYMKYDKKMMSIDICELRELINIRDFIKLSKLSAIMDERDFEPIYLSYSIGVFSWDEVLGIIDAMRELTVKYRHFKLPLDGNEISIMTKKKGPELGRFIKTLRNETLNGCIPYTKEGLINYINLYNIFKKYE